MHISLAKKKCWTKLSKTIDADPWGKPYKIVMRKLRGNPATAQMDLGEIRDIVNTLFPQPPNPPTAANETTRLEECEIPLFSKEEVDKAVNKFKMRKKAPGPDNIPSRICGVLHKARLEMITEVFNDCLKDGTSHHVGRKQNWHLSQNLGKQKDTHLLTDHCASWITWERLWNRY